MAVNYSDFVVKNPFTAYEFGEGFVSLDSANQIAIFPFVVPFPLLVTNIAVRILVADGSNNSDIGIYDADGNRLGHIGAQHLSSTGVVSIVLTDGPIVIGPGLYFLAITSVATTLQWSVGSNGASTAISSHTSATSSSGGTLPSTISLSQSFGNSQVQGCPPVMVLI